MEIRRTERVVLFVTTRELRELADRLDVAWDKVRLGEDVPSETVSNWEDRLEIIIRIDQERQRPKK